MDEVMKFAIPFIFIIVPMGAIILVGTARLVKELWKD